MKEVTNTLRIEHWAVKAYRPSANGLVENKNKTIIGILRFLVADDPQEWPKQLPLAALALNTAYNRALGDNPHFLVHCQDARLPYDVFLNASAKRFYDIESYRTFICSQGRKVFDLVKRSLEKEGENNAEEYNIKFKTQDSRLRAGDRVFIKRLAPRKHKLEGHFIGPFRIVERNAQAVKVKNLRTDKISEVHLSHVLMVKECHVENISNGTTKPQVFPVGDYELEDTVTVDA